MPVSAISAAFSSVTPPDASITSRPPTSATASAARHVEVVEQHDVGQAAIQHVAQLLERIDLDLDLHQVADDGRARAPAPARMPPATAMWLSLISIASSRPKRWLMPPPQRTAYFCSARSPGVVLRVQRRAYWCLSTRATIPPSRSRCRTGGREIQRDALGREHGPRLAGRPSSATYWRPPYRRRGHGP